MRTRFVAVIACLLAGPGVVLACDYPSVDAVIMPDGATAEKEDMLAGQKSVKAYVKDMEDYLTCIRIAYTGNDKQPTPQEENVWTARHNAAVDAMDSVAARFNEQVRVFKARQRP